MGAGLGLGALGGAAAGNGGAPATDRPELLPTLSVAGVLTSALVLVVAVAIFALLGPSVQRAANEAGRTISISGEMLNAIAIVTNFVMLIVWQMLGLWSARRLQTTESPALRAMMVTVSIVIGVLPFLTVIFLILIAYQAFFAWWMIVCAILSMAVGAYTLRIGWEMRRNVSPMKAGQISLSTLALIGALLSGIMISATYISATAVSLNIVLLDIPLIEVLATQDSAKAAEAAAHIIGGVPILVQSNFATHLYVLYVGVGVGVFLTLLALAAGWVINRWVASRK